MRRSRMTTCSISRTVIAKGAKVSKSACVIPGLSIPETNISPVYRLLSVLTERGYRESLEPRR